MFIEHPQMKIETAVAEGLYPQSSESEVLIRVFQMLTEYPSGM